MLFFQNLISYIPKLSYFLEYFYKFWNQLQKETYCKPRVYSETLNSCKTALFFLLFLCWKFPGWATVTPLHLSFPEWVPVVCVGRWGVISFLIAQRIRWVRPAGLSLANEAIMQQWGFWFVSGASPGISPGCYFPSPFSQGVICLTLQCLCSALKTLDEGRAQSSVYWWIISCCGALH